MSFSPETDKEIIVAIETNPKYFREVVFTSNPEMHAATMRAFGVDASADPIDLENKFVKLQKNNSYIKAMLSVPVIEENLPEGYVELLQKSNQFQTTPKGTKVELKGIPPVEDTGNSATTDNTTDNTTDTNTTDGGKPFNWNLAGSAAGNFINHLFGMNTNNTNGTPPPRRGDNTIWYVGAVILLVVVGFLFFKPKK